VTEVPEYLLRRSRERREALGLATGGGETPPSSEPAPAAELPSGEATTAEVPAVVEPEAEVVPTAPAYVAPAGPRSGIPAWMLPVLAILPFWAFIYVYALEPQESTTPLTPIQLGAQVYNANCASCHAADGAGVGDYPPLAGEVLKTFPEEADHITWVQEGSQTKAEGTPYGDPNREGGQQVVELRAMPGFAGTLSPEELDAVVLYERETFK
jgi:mono/diheme cytochrome c family protein